MLTIGNYIFKGKKALVRVDFNVPLDTGFGITDDTRIVASLPTIRKIIEDGGSVILMSHLGRPKGGYEEKFSLKHIVSHLSALLGINVQFAPVCIGSEAKEKAAMLKPGEVLLLENLRFYKEEEAGDEQFARKLAALGDVYVNDAFATAHRAHASTTIVARYFSDKLFGYLMMSEIDSLEKVLLKPVHPFTAIVGGAKVSTKISILENLMGKVDNLIIGGGMAFTFVRAMGGKVGSSMVEEDNIYMAYRIMEMVDKKKIKIYLPVDAVVADKFDNDAQRKTSAIDKIEPGWMGLDIGNESIMKFEEIIEASKTILWNGPMGVFEMPNFEKGTHEIALSVVRATAAGSFSLVGGGDLVAAMHKFGLAGKVSYVSTAGGAMLEFLEGKDLPGIKAIKG
ncbi:MAG: phosphoglycerate kinase [Bacteroidia bacterium]|nr:phosphoglycerate kinase [Bacteroidia bacterium]